MALLMLLANRLPGVKMPRGSIWMRLCLEIWILALQSVSVNSQCQPPSSPIFQVQETDPAGSSILSLSATGGATWRYVFTESKHAPLREYLNFTKDGQSYNMVLVKPLDLEELRDKYQIGNNGFTMILYCSEPSKGETGNNILLTSSAVNEFPPKFNTSSIHVYVTETPTPVTVVNLIDWASDEDINPMSTEIDGFGFLDPPNPLLGIRTVRGSVYTISALDYESLPENKKYLEVGVLVRDTGDKTGTATLTIHVMNADDLPPRFTYRGCPDPCSSVSYSAAFNANATGKVLGIKPAPIQAVDGDDLGSSITYSINQGPSGYVDYISMNPTTGEVNILKPLQDLKVTEVVIIFQAQENNLAMRSTKTSLLISVQDGAGPIPLASASTNKDDVVIVGVVLGIIVFIILIILIVAMIYYRKRFSKVVHPDNGAKEAKEEHAADEVVRRDEKPSHQPQEHPRSIILTDEEMKVDEEITTWLPSNRLSDIVDLSDEDTLKRKKKNGMAPNSTQMNSRDSAFEESSVKTKSGSEDSHRDPDPDFDPVTEYAEVGTPTECNNDWQVKSQDHVYVPDPTAEQRPSKENHNNINDSGVEEAEYLTPNSTRVKLQTSAAAYNKGCMTSTTDPDTSVYSDIISIDGDHDKNKHDSLTGISTGAAAHVQHLEGNAIASSSPKPKSHRSKKSDKDSNSPRSLSDEAEITEYSTPRSEKSSHGMSNSTRRFNDEEVLSPHQPIDLDDDDRPEVPPRPKIRQVSGLKVKASDEVHYASVQKKSLRKHKREPSENDESPSSPNNNNNNNNNNSNNTVIDSCSKEEVESKIDPPMRRKRHRKRSKQVKAPEEDIYDGTKDYEDLEMDPEFYLDTNKTKIKRSSRAPATLIDPDDTQYWITVTNDY